MKNVFDHLEGVLGFDLMNFFDEYESFVYRDLQRLEIYYKGDLETFPQTAFERLDKLSTKASVIYESFRSNLDRFDKCIYYEYFDIFEDYYFKLETFRKMPKWIKKSSYISSKDDSYSVGKRESLELSAKRLGYQIPDEGVMEITLNNHIKELDYDLSGNLIFEYKVVSRGRLLQLESVIEENIVGEKVYGIDLDREIRFLNNDLKILSPKETFIQSCNIIVNLKKGDNPEIPFEGIDKTLLSNRVTATMTFPILLRQLTSLVSKDDTIKAFEIKDIEWKDDAMFLSLNFYSHLQTSILIQNEN